MMPGDHIVTTANSRASIRFWRRRDCLLILEPNTSFKFMTLKKGVYSANLDMGAVKCQKASCGLNLSVMTPAAKLHGESAEFLLQAYRGFTTVVLKKGSLRLFVGGQTFALRKMTRTTVSKTGAHRVTAISTDDLDIPGLFSLFPDFMHLLHNAGYGKTCYFSDLEVATPLTNTTLKPYYIACDISFSEEPARFAAHQPSEPGSWWEYLFSGSGRSAAW